MQPMDSNTSRTSPEHIARFRREYDEAKRAYVGGYISKVDATRALELLGYRHSALRVELFEWYRERDMKERDDRGFEK